MAIQLPLAGTKYQPAQLELLGEEHELNLTPERLAGEIQCIVQLRNTEDLFAGSYIYSISVQEPHSITVENLPIMQLPEALQFEVRRGYLLHESLYQLSAQAQETVLKKILESASAVEVSLTAKQGATCQHKLVRLRAVE